MTHIPHRDLAERTPFITMATGTGSALTLSHRHMVYVSNEDAGTWVPMAARDVKVCVRHGIECIPYRQLACFAADCCPTKCQSFVAKVCIIRVTYVYKQMPGVCALRWAI